MSIPRAEERDKLRPARAAQSGQMNTVDACPSTLVSYPYWNELMFVAIGPSLRTCQATSHAEPPEGLTRLARDS